MKSNHNNPGTKVLQHCAYYTEGPVVDRDRIFFTTLTGGKIMCREKSGHIYPWAAAVCPNGQFICDDGDHLICESKEGQVLRYDPEGRLRSVLAYEQSCPNDIIGTSAGCIIFTNSVRYTGNVVLLDPAGQLDVIITGLDYPNGLALSADAKTLYIAESYRNRILRAEMDETFRVISTNVLATLPEHTSGNELDNLPDGIKVDAEGNIWVAHYGMGSILKLSQSGELMAVFETGMPLTSNLALTSRSIIVTGGYAEPGPGALLEIFL